MPLSTSVLPSGGPVVMSCVLLYACSFPLTPAWPGQWSTGVFAAEDRARLCAEVLSLCLAVNLQWDCSLMTKPFVQITMPCSLPLALTSVEFSSWPFMAVCFWQQRVRTLSGISSIPLLAHDQRDSTHAGLTVLLGPSKACLLPVCTLFFFDSAVELIIEIMHRTEVRFDQAPPCSFHWWQVQQILYGFTGCVFSCSRDKSHGFFFFFFAHCYASSGYDRVVRSRPVNDAEYLIPIQQEKMRPYRSMLQP